MAGPHTPNRRVVRLSSHQILREFLLSPAWGWYFPSTYVTVCSLCPLLLDISVFGMPSFPGHRDRPDLLFFLGQTSHERNRASSLGSTGCSCIYTVSGIRGLPSLTCLFVYIVFLKSWYAKKKVPRDPNSSSPALECKTPFRLPGI